MMDQIIKIAWDLNDNTDNRYKLVYEIAELAKKLVDENQAKKAHDDFNFEENFDTTYKKENPVEHAIMVKAAEADEDRLVGYDKFFVAQVNTCAILCKKSYYYLKNY